MPVVLKALSLRRAGPEDCQLVWEWANAPEVRAASFEPDPIPWESHCRWFAAKLRDPRCHFFILLAPKNQPIGQVRLEETTDRQAVISISLAPQVRGLGLGPAAIRLAVGEVFRTTALTAIHAYIKPENQSSLRAFIKAGFQPAGLTVVKEQPAAHYFLTRETMAYADCLHREPYSPAES